MEAFFLIIHVLLAIALIGIVLIQRSSTDGFGLGSGSGAGFMTGRQAANLLTRSTAIIATLFILNSLWLGWIATHRSSVSITDQIEAAADKQTEKGTGEKAEKQKPAKADTSDKAKAEPSDEKELKDKKSDKPAASAPAVPVAD